MRQSLIAVFAMVLVLVVAAYEDFRGKQTLPKLRISGAISQWSTASSDRTPSVSFRLGAFPYDLGIDARALDLLAKQGMTQPFSVGTRVDAIVVKSEVTVRENADRADRRAVGAIPVLGLTVEGRTVLGGPEVFRLAPTMRTWPYLLLLSAFGAAIFFARKRRSARRRARRADYDGEDSR